VTHVSRDTVLAGALPLGGAALLWGLLALGCGNAMDDEAGFTLASSAECQQLGGAPLFDLEDDRPLDRSCPEGLVFLAAFEEEFYGDDWGICCADPDAPEEPLEGAEPGEPAEPSSTDVAP
jgi:hypothetical protein